ncbi:hypothetical protein ILUMI_21191 [Ignelater luminosus]|uniref:Elongation factor 1-delta n=1 Tax=Ignelater luminosus TaxID=2038154 RepID=A0A8K0FY64_IGNLU|nr:hypothetical protein ILUMI_21191 [Ignelater luminosus]
MAQNLGYEKVWLDKSKYEAAEYEYYESKAKPSPQINECHKHLNPAKLMEEQLKKFEKILTSFEQRLNEVVVRVQKLEEVSNASKTTHPVSLNNVTPVTTTTKDQDDEDDVDDVDLFGSDSEEDEEALKVRQKRLADYEQRKSKKPVLIAKSNIILDVKPWDDETDMKVMEEAVRAIQTDGLVWGAAKLVPLAYGIHKLQISCVVEDDKVSVDWLQEQIEEISDYVQSVDIAAFNKV